jgi:hypothetical protein
MRRQSMLLVEPRQLEWVIEDLPPFVGSSDGWDYQEHARWYFDVVRGHSYNLEQIFNYHTTPGDLAATFERLATGAITPTKVLVHYDNNIRIVP